MRSDAIYDKIKDEVIVLLETTILTCEQIGKLFNCSRGPIYKILKKYNISRPLGGSTPPKKQIKYCKFCNKPISGTISITRPNRYKYCNKICYTNWQKSDNNKGINHPSYIDGGKHETYINKLRKSDEWKKWRESIYTRDNYTCKLCGTSGKTIHPHHILPKKYYPELIFDINNGVTLCVECHTNTKTLHSKISKYHDILKASMIHQ